MLYTYRCNDCEATTMTHRTVDDRHNAPTCQVCGGETKKIIGVVSFSVPMGGHNNPGYICPVTDEWVDSKRKRQRIMAEHDLVEMPKNSA